MIMSIIIKPRHFMPTEYNDFTVTVGGDNKKITENSLSTRTQSVSLLGACPYKSTYSNLTISVQK